MLFFFRDNYFIILMAYLMPVQPTELYKKINFHYELIDTRNEVRFFSNVI